MVNLRIDSYMEVDVHRHSDLNLFREAAQRLEPADSLGVGALSLHQDHLEHILQSLVVRLARHAELVREELDQR